MYKLVLISLLLSSTMFAMEQDSLGHLKTIDLPVDLKDPGLSQIACDCGELEGEHYCGSYALLHALILENRNGRHSDFKPIEELNQAFDALTILPNTVERTSIENIVRVANYLKLRHYPIQYSEGIPFLHNGEKDRLNEADLFAFTNVLDKINIELFKNPNDNVINHFLVSFKLEIARNLWVPHVILVSLIKNGRHITTQIWDNMNGRIGVHSQYSEAIKLISHVFAKSINRDLLFRNCADLFGDKVGNCEAFCVRGYNQKHQRDGLLHGLYSLWVPPTKEDCLKDNKLNITSLNRIIKPLKELYLDDYPVAKTLLIDTYNAMIDVIEISTVTKKRKMQLINSVISAIEKSAEQNIFSFSANEEEQELKNRAAKTLATLK